MLLLSAGALAAQTDVHAMADKVDQRYDHLHTLQADFTETYTGAGMSRTESGTLLLKKPGQMRWDYDQPRPKLFVTDGHTAWFYVPGEKQARRTSIKQLDDLRSPLRYLLGKTKLEKELEGLSLAPDQKPMNAGDVVLRGVPKGMRDRVEADSAGDRAGRADHAHRGGGIGRLDHRIPLSSAEGERPTSRSGISFRAAARGRGGGGNRDDGIAKIAQRWVGVKKEPECQGHDRGVRLAIVKAEC